MDEVNGKFDTYAVFVYVYAHVSYLLHLYNKDKTYRRLL